MATHKKIKINPNGQVEIQHFDSGGTVVGYGPNPLTDVSNALTVQNQYQAGVPDISTQENNYNAANAGQNELTKALWNQANGQGANPAQLQLQNNANQIAGQAAAQAASNRGLNAGQAQRLANQGQVAAGQIAAGQSAALQAQQQLNAEQGLASVYGQQENAASTNASVVNQGQLGAAGINAGIAQNNANAVNDTQGGILKGLPIVGSFFGAEGGIVPDHIKTVKDIYHAQYFDWGGAVQPASLAAVNIPNLPSYTPKQKDSKSAAKPGPASIIDSPGSATEANNFGAGELTMPELGSSAGLGASPAAAALLASGGKVPGKPKVDHNDYKNDTVPAMLSPGEVVIPLDVMNSDDPVKNGAKFIADHLAKNKKDDSHEDDFREALKRASAGRK